MFVNGNNVEAGDDGGWHYADADGDVVDSLSKYCDEVAHPEDGLYSYVHRFHLRLHCWQHRNFWFVVSRSF